MKKNNTSAMLSAQPRTGRGVALGSDMKLLKCEKCGKLRDPNKLRCFCINVETSRLEIKNYTVVE